MEWVGGGSGMGKERRSRLSRSRSIESRDSSGRRSGSYQTHRRKRFERDRLRSQSRSSDSNFSEQEYSNATYQSRKRHRKRKVEADAPMNLPSEVSLNKLTKVMTSLVESSSNHPAGKADMAPDFDPEDRTITSESWCRKMDDLKVIFNWSDESTIYFAASKLRGLANAWYNGFPNRQYVWSEFKDKLKSAFPSKRNYYELLQQMMARRKLGNEKYVTYYYDKLSLLKVCNITGDDAVSCIVAGITDQAVRSGAEAADFIGMEALLGYMTAVENIPGSSKELSKDRKHNSSKSGASTKSSAGCYICGMDDHYSNKCPQQPFKKTSPTSCYKCGSDGHFAKDCRNGGRCFRCGGEDHFVISCPQAKAPPGKVSSATCYMCGVEGHIAQFCPDAYKIRSKNCFTCHKRGHLAIVCPIAKYSPARCTYCGKVGHQENGCYNKMDDARYDQSQIKLSEQGVSGGSSNLRSDPYDVYEECLNRRNDRDEYNYSVMALPKRQTEEIRNPGNGQDEYVALSEGELGSEHST